MKAEEVKKIADLSRIKISQKEIKEFSGQLSDILSYVNKVQEYDFIAKKYDSLGEVSKLREDKVGRDAMHCVCTEEIIKQFSDRSGKLLKVKKIL